MRQLRAVSSTLEGARSTQVVPPPAEPLSVDIGQVGSRQDVVQPHGADRPAQQSQDDERLEPPEPARRVDQCGQRSGPQQVRHDRDDAVVKQVGRADELLGRIRGGRHVAMDGVLEFAVEDESGESQRERDGPGVPCPALVPARTVVVLQVVDRQPEACPQGEAQEEVAREDAQVLLERVCHSPFEADGDELGDDEHDQRGKPGRPARICKRPPKPRHDAEMARRHVGHSCLHGSNE